MGILRVESRDRHLDGARLQQLDNSMQTRPTMTIFWPGNRRPVAGLVWAWGTNNQGQSGLRTNAFQQLAFSKRELAEGRTSKAVDR